ncbi:MAG TPA: 50S ribosomal protein L17 [Anaerolineae bacterium]
MRHGQRGKKLGRSTSQRRALFQSLLNALIENERIKTTESKAKAVRGDADKLITLAKKDSVHARRLAFARLNNKSAVEKLFATIAPRFGERKGGYTRILKTGPRAGDAAPMAILEFTEKEA